MKIKKEIFEKIIEYVKEDQEKERCGIIAGKEGIGEKVYFLKNISENPQMCYLIDPVEQIKVFKEMRNEGLELLSIFHSHIGAEPYPSKRDIELAYYPEAYYLIFSVKGEYVEYSAFLIKESGIEEVEIKLI